ncbi:MAG: hypothetical protein AB8B88_13595 [Devosiaceae bacterium]
MRFRPLTKPLHAPRRARVLAALSLLTLLAAIALVGAGFVSLRGALVGLAVSAGLGVMAILGAVYGLNYIWSKGGKGIADCALALLWALPVITSVAGLTFIVTQTPTYPDLATNVNNPPPFQVLGQTEDEAQLPLDAASPADRIRIQLANPDLTTEYVERPGWHVAEVLETYAQTSGWELARLETENGLSFEAEFTVPGSLLLTEHDIAMRISDDGEGSTIDARALSNIPLHDFGTNAPVLTGVLQRFLLAIEATPPPTSDL